MITQAWIGYENLLLSRGQIKTKWACVCLRGAITHQDEGPLAHSEASLKRKGNGSILEPHAGSSCYLQGPSTQDNSPNPGEGQTQDKLFMLHFHRLRRAKRTFRQSPWKQRPLAAPHRG